MAKRIKIGSEFISMTQPEDKLWIRNIYHGIRDRTGRHLHLVISGGAAIAETWYLRDMDDNVIIENGSEVTNNASQLLLDCIPEPLKELQHPEQPLSWNVGSLDSFFSLQKKHPQLKP